ncbi:glycoside hydrolase [Niastella yeongjuensis]|uniref:chitinase n=1 Tax=Niastella yeongjuensis TaxID=354355 RepID=A0A1V9F811_9BACT|nr:glycosyl hydrolase family 18 protein [Niastella yeongjuensis]OQP54504.1 glycoside hydrolase [Niastella yeongjuensis]SEN97103.1 Por secretion system C-terminal sorting domain-containing protein [Niastella yeongjuensis]
MKKNLPGKIFLALLMLAGVERASAQFKVVGYMPSWAGDVNAIQYSKVTHINYAFLNCNGNGTLQGLDNPGKLSSLVSKGHANGVKVMISVGGWNDGNTDNFEAMAGNSTNRNTFVQAMINFVNQYNLDGIDIDWEYPRAGQSANNYLTLMTTLSNEMHSRGKLLTAAVVGDGGSSILNGVFNVVDFLNLMAYDYNDYQHSTFAYGQQSMNYWRGRGLPKEKCILGVPFYGRPGSIAYVDLLARGANPYNDTYNGIGYNGITTIKNKTNLAFDNGNGIMIWELSNDATGANSLLSAIHDVVLTRGGGGTNPPPTGTNIALNKTVTVSSVEESQYAGNFAVDGNTATRWSSVLAVDPQVITIDLGKPYNISEIRLLWEAAYAKNFVLEVSSDNATWSNVKTVTGNTSLTNDYTGLTNTGRYVRLTGTARGTEWGYSLYEFEVYGKDTTTTPPPTSGVLIQAESYSTMSGVQTEATTDTDGGQDVGWIDQGDWMAFYNINFPVTGTYKVEYRVASLNGGGRVSCDLNAGSIQLGQIDVPSTGGWQNWTTISQNVTVNAGTYNFGVYAQASGWNLNWVRITPVTTTTKQTTRMEAINGLVDASIQGVKAFNIYPNPVQQQLNIQSSESLDGGIIRIFDIMGKVVMSARAASNKINVSSLTPGVYTLMFTKGEKKITRQFIK